MSYRELIRRTFAKMGKSAGKSAEVVLVVVLGVVFILGPVVPIVALFPPNIVTVPLVAGWIVVSGLFIGTMVDTWDDMKRESRMK